MQMQEKSPLKAAFEGQRGAQKQKQECLCLLIHSSFSKCLQWLELGHVRTGNWELNPGLPQRQQKADCLRQQGYLSLSVLAGAKQY